MRTVVIPGIDGSGVLAKLEDTNTKVKCEYPKLDIETGMTDDNGARSVIGSIRLWGEDPKSPEGLLDGEGNQITGRRYPVSMPSVGYMGSLHI